MFEKGIGTLIINIKKESQIFNIEFIIDLFWDTIIINWLQTLIWIFNQLAYLL